MKKLLLILALLLLPLSAFALTTRTIVNPASNSPLSSSVMRNKLQILENEITQDLFPHRTVPSPTTRPLAQQMLTQQPLL